VRACRFALFFFFFFFSSSVYLSDVRSMLTGLARFMNRKCIVKSTFQVAVREPLKHLDWDQQRRIIHRAASSATPTTGHPINPWTRKSRRWRKRTIQLGAVANVLCASVVSGNVKHGDTRVRMRVCETGPSVHTSVHVRPLVRYARASSRVHAGGHAHAWAQRITCNYGSCHPPCLVPGARARKAVRISRRTPAAYVEKRTRA
jgi:hypothetical protein